MRKITPIWYMRKGESFIFVFSIQFSRFTIWFYCKPYYISFRVITWRRMTLVSGYKHLLEYLTIVLSQTSFVVRHMRVVQLQISRCIAQSDQRTTLSAYLLKSIVLSRNYIQFRGVINDLIRLIHISYVFDAIDSSANAHADQMLHMTGRYPS